jgi:methionyl-tRNA synthetase
MPQAAARLLDQIAISPSERVFSSLHADASMAGGQGINKPEPIFPRYIAEEQDAT